MARGTRNVGLLEQLGYRRKSKAPAPRPTAEQVAAGRAVTESYLRKMALDGGVPPDQIDQWVAGRAA